MKLYAMRGIFRFKEAFELINCSILLIKLEHYIICGNVLQVILFHKSRTCVLINNVYNKYVWNPSRFDLTAFILAIIQKLFI